MMNYRLTPEAETNLVDIVEFIATDNPDAADRVLGEFQTAFARLGEMPGLGHYREDLLPQTFRFHSVYSYLIVYRAAPTAIEIVAIIHGARDLREQFKQRSIE